MRAPSLKYRLERVRVDVENCSLYTSRCTQLSMPRPKDTKASLSRIEVGENEGDLQRTGKTTGAHNGLR